MSWDSLRGHDAIVKRFAHAYAAGRLGQAYLLYGPEGVGKKRFAVELAKTLLCEDENKSFNSCGRCPACHLVDAKTHPDFKIDGKPDDKNELPKDVIEKINDFIFLSLSRAKHKVAIIDDADWMSVSSSNTFLKTLEEPPPGTLILLISASLDAILPTIKSRCQWIRFRELTDADVRSILMSQNVPETDALRLAGMCGGRPGLAIALNDPAIFEYRQALLSALTATPFRRSALIELTNGFIEAAGKESIAKKQRARIAFEFIIGFVRSALRLASGSDDVREYGPDRELLAGLGRKLGPDRLLDAIDTISQADVRIDRSVPLPIVVEALVDQLGRLHPTTGRG